jgi:hypothetical protein
MRPSLALQSLLAALVLFVQALAPGLHGLVHRHEVAGDGTVYCVVHQTVHRTAPVPPTGVFEVEDEAHPETCSVCQLLREVRDLWSPAGDEVVRALVPPRPLDAKDSGVLPVARAHRLPPVRGPPAA